MKVRRRLDRTTRGAALLKRKRESLVAELLRRARPAVVSREAIDEEARAAWRALWQALAAEGSEALMVAGWPERELHVDLETQDVRGLRIVALRQPPRVARSLAARGVLPAPGEAAGQQAARAFESLVERLVEAAPKEQAMRRLGQALARATRLVNTLERQVAVRLAADAAAIRRTLDEREREERGRTRRLIARRRGGATPAGGA